MSQFTTRYIASSSQRDKAAESARVYYTFNRGMKIVLNYKLTILYVGSQLSRMILCSNKDSFVWNLGILMRSTLKEGVEDYGNVILIIWIWVQSYILEEKNISPTVDIPTPRTNIPTKEVSSVSCVSYKRQNYTLLL